MNRLQNQLQHNIPEELYKIQPGQVAYFVSQEGINQKTAGKIYSTIVNLDSSNDEPNNVNIIPTDNELLIDTIAGRNANEVGFPYNVIIGTFESYDRFEDELTGEANDEPSPDDTFPFTITIDSPCPKKESHSESFSCPFMGGGGMQALVEEKNQPTMEELQGSIATILSKCEQYGYDVDVVSLKNTIRESYRQARDYQLELDFVRHKAKLGHNQSNTLDVCDIYIVGDGKKHLIDIRPGEKALYLTTILEGGFYLSDVSFTFLEDMSIIFKQIPDHQEKENGLATQNQSSSGVGVMKKRIKDAIIKAIGYSPAVDEFAIEGYRKQEVSVRKANKKHVELIKQYFGL